MHENQLKKKLKAGRAVLGCFVRYANADVVEFLALQGFDFLVLDAEHGPLEPGDCQQLVRAAELRGTTPIVRVPTNQQALILRYMDTGAAGAQVPMVCSAAEAEAAVRAIKYQPLGARGLAGTRAADWGQRQSLAQYVPYANEQTLVVVQVETAAAVEHLDEIVRVDGVDGIFVGPTDLSNSLGVPGQIDHPKMQQTFDRIVDVMAGSDKFLATIVGNAEAAQKWIQRGAQYLTVTCEIMINTACKAYLEAARRAI